MDENQETNQSTTFEQPGDSPKECPISAEDAVRMLRDELDDTAEVAAHYQRVTMWAFYGACIGIIAASLIAALVFKHRQRARLSMAADELAEGDQ